MNYRSCRISNILSRLGQLAAIVLFITACTGESNLPTASGDAAFRMINAIPTSPSLAFLIEERAIGSAEYKAASAPATYDNLKYTFNFEAFLAGEITRSRLASMDIDVERDLEYTFLVSGPLATPTITLWESARREWAGTETDFQARFAHTAESLGPVDVYFLAPGVAPAPGLEAGTLSFTQVLPPLDYAAGDYAVIFTTAGDANDILFTSNTLTPAAQSGFVISLFDADANDVGPFAVRQFGDVGGSANLVDAGSSPTIRLFHATPNLETADVYTDELLAEQLSSGHAFRDVTGDLPLAAGAYTLTYTAAGNVGSILLEDDVSILQGNHYDFYVVGEIGALNGIQQIPDRRSVETLVKFSFLHTATNHDSVDLYIVTAGSDIAESQPRIANLTIGSSPANLSLQAGDFELYLTTNQEKTVLAGPIAFSPQLGDVANFISYDNVDPAIADIVLIPQP